MSLLALAAGGIVQPVTAIEDVFSAYTYTGNGTSQTITNGIDLAGKGGLVWIKARANAFDHFLFDTVRGAGNRIITDSAVGGSAGFGQSFTSTGVQFTDGGSSYNDAVTYISWSFAQAAKFFKVAQVTVSGSNQTVDLSSLGTVGMVTVKRTDAASNWFVFHRSATSGKLLYLNGQDVEATLGHITLSGTTLTLVQATIGNGTYIVYAWAHDTGADGLIQCGTFTTDGSGDAAVTLGWEPQYVIWKTLTTNTHPWTIVDTARAWSKSTFNRLWTEQSSAEDIVTNTAQVSPNALGFNVGNGNMYTSTPYVYLAIRRGPMKKPTVGTQVYEAWAGTQGSQPSTSIISTGFPVDLAIGDKCTGGNYGPFIVDRLRGNGKYLRSDGTSGTNAEASGSGFNVAGVGAQLSIKTLLPFDYSPGSPDIQVLWFFRRYPGVFDVVCYTGTDVVHTVSHNLTVVPQLMIIKIRGSHNGEWEVYSVATGAGMYLSLNNATRALDGSSVPNLWNNTTPTATNFTIGTSGVVNFSGDNFVVYLFATLAGISKVGSFTGNGTNQTIDCGFTTGARFVLIKRTDATGDWYVWDSVRGIVASTDPHLSLNTAAAEVTTDDSVDPDSSGFIVNQLAATNINVSAASYIYLAFA